MTIEEERVASVERIVRWLRYVLAAVLVAVTIVITANRWMAYRACQASRMDRIDNAAGWTAHREYIKKVTGAASVKEDVKRAAREANHTYTSISSRLSERADVNCRGIVP